MSYTFKDDIEKVFDIFFNQSLLDKAGHLIKVTPKEKVINKKKLVSSTTFFIHRCNTHLKQLKAI